MLIPATLGVMQNTKETNSYYHNDNNSKAILRKFKSKKQRRGIIHLSNAERKEIFLCFLHPIRLYMPHQVQTYNNRNIHK